MKVMNVAVVGAGIYGINHVNAYTWNPNTNLVAVCDLNKEITDRIAKEYNVKTYNDVNEMLDNEEIDAVSIATPDAFHMDPALAPIRGYMCMDDIIDVPTEWFNWADKSSPVHFLGTHCYDQIRWYMGCEVEEVYAVGTKKVLKGRGVDTYDTIQATLKMENGCYWTVENSWILPKGFAKNNDGRTQILCENAMFRIDSQNRGVELYNNSKLRTPNSYFILNNCGRPSGFGIEPINDFIYCLQNDIPFVADGNDGLQAERRKNMTIKEVAEKYDISADTLRYYERVGMIPKVTRKANGIRDYQESDLGWVELALCMRSAGLPVEVMIEYVKLYKEGDNTIPARLELLQEQMNSLKEQKEQIESTMERLAYKISKYEEAVETGVLVWNEGGDCHA
jgi:predicted dehydrogenase